MNQGGGDDDPTADKAFAELQVRIEGAQAVRTLFEAHVAVGFNEAQAMQIILAVLSATIRNSAGAGTQ